MTVTAVDLATAKAVEAGTDAVSSQGSGRSFFVLAVDVPTARTWQSQMRFGADRGCAIVDVR